MVHKTTWAYLTYTFFLFAFIIILLGPITIIFAIKATSMRSYLLAIAGNIMAWFLLKEYLKSMKYQRYSLELKPNAFVEYKNKEIINTIEFQKVIRVKPAKKPFSVSGFAIGLFLNRYGSAPPDVEITYIDKYGTENVFVPKGYLTLSEVLDDVIKKYPYVEVQKRDFSYYLNFWANKRVFDQATPKEMRRYWLNLIMGTILLIAFFAFAVWILTNFGLGSMPLTGKIQ